MFQAKLDSLQTEAAEIEKEKPSHAAIIRDDIRRIQQVWDVLNRKVREHEAKLDEAGDLQRFLRDLDHFQAWLTATQRQVINGDSFSFINIVLDNKVLFRRVEGMIFFSLLI